MHGIYEDFYARDDDARCAYMRSVLREHIAFFLLDADARHHYEAAMHTYGRISMLIL